MDVFDAMGTAVTMRWLRPDPVPDELLDKLIWAGTRAASPENSQLWDFVVVRSPEQRARLHDAIVPDPVVLDPIRTSIERTHDPIKQRIFTGSLHLLETLRTAPVLIFICGSSLIPGDPREDRFMFSAIYGAAQNMLVAGRALGLGVSAISAHHRNVRAVRKILGVPDHTTVAVTMPVGFAARPYGTLKRKPIEDVIHYDHW
jgi:nitroreductase